MLFTVGRFDRDLPGLAEYVQVGGDEPIGVHDKAGSQALLLAVASGERDDHHGLSGRGGDLLGSKIYNISPTNGFLYCVIATTLVYALILPLILLVPVTTAVLP